MTQWGFYFDQSRCIGCKTCMLACKNWNEEKRGDAKINKLNIEKYMTPVGAMENGSVYVRPDTGANNYEEYRQYYMKEDWRRVETFDRGHVTLDTNTRTFKSNLDRRYMSISCNHCDDPACVNACPTGSIKKDQATGIVLVPDSGCMSCGKCKDACPWDAPQFYDNVGKYNPGDNDIPVMTKCTLCYDRINEGLKPMCVAACWNRALDAGPMDELRARYLNSVDKLPEFADDKGAGPNIIFKGK